MKIPTVLLLIVLPLYLCAAPKEKAKHKKMALRDSLDAYWDMEQNPLLFPVHDQTGNGHHLTGFGGPAQVTGKLGKAIEFAADTEFLDLLTTTHVVLDLNGKDFTVATWFKPAELVNNTGILGSHFQKWYARIISSAGNYYVEVKIANGGLTISDVPLQVGQWYFLAFGWHNSPATQWGQYTWGTVNLGVRAREVRAPFVNDNPAFGIGAAGTGFAFRGAVDDTAIWSRRVAAHELHQIYNDGDGLPFEEWGDPVPCQSIECCD